MFAKSTFAIACVMFMAAAVYASDTPATVDKMKAALTPGEFVLSGSQVKKLHDDKQAKEYRVCVKNEKDSSSMKVMYDGQEAVLRPGDCMDVTGKKISATPEHELTGGAHIVATFHHEKPSKQ